ncbi:MAG: HEAT repeat domain-containing protein [Gammaproteobacteria bacterium]
MAQEAPLAPLMQEISRCTGVEILGLDKLERKISIQFSNLALAEGLRRLLGEFDHVFIADQPTDDAALPRRVLLLGTANVERELGTTQFDADGMSSPIGEQKEAEKRLETLENSANAGDLQAMREALRDPDPLVQTRALELLAEADREEAAAQLLEMTRSDERPVRMQALDLLNESEVVDERSIVSTLGSALTDTDPAATDTEADRDLKQLAIEGLAERGGAEAMAYLKQALRDPDPKVRRFILESAAPYDEEQVLLKEACFDEDDTVRSLAIAWWPQCATGEDDG